MSREKYRYVIIGTSPNSTTPTHDMASMSVTNSGSMPIAFTVSASMPTARHIDSIINANTTPTKIYAAQIHLLLFSPPLRNMYLKSRLKIMK